MTTREGRTEHKGRTAFWVYAAGWLALGLFAAPLLAADPDITIEQLRPKNVGKLELKLRPSLAAIRSDAPFTIELDLDSTFPDLMEGDLELTFVDDGEVRLRLQTGPLAVPNGQQSFRLFLPAMAANQERANFVVPPPFMARADRSIWGRTTSSSRSRASGSFCWPPRVSAMPRSMSSPGTWGSTHSGLPTPAALSS